jgi:tripartite-type tricarboxylate transporter receptor subunit TctC
MLAVASMSVLAALVIAGEGHAQPYPTRPVRVIVGFGPGAPDSVARIISPQLAARMGHPFVVENRSGANGSIGANVVAKAPADGLTLLITSASIAVNPSTYRKLPFDVLRDLAPVTNIASGEGYILVVNPSVPARSVQELIALARKPGSKFAYGSPGPGSPMQLAGGMFAAKTGTDMVHAAYKGAGPAIIALLAGEIQLMFATPPLSVQHISSGKLRALAYTGSKRAPFLPNVPIMAEAGIPGMVLDAMSWYGMFVPAKTPESIITRLYEETHAIVQDPKVVERLRSLNVEPEGSMPAAFRKFVEAEVKRFAEMVKLAGYQPE